MLHKQHYHGMLLLLIINLNFAVNVTSEEIGIGVILDMDSSVGKVSTICIKMALQDFYQTHNYTTKIVTHFRDSKHDRVKAASAGWLITYFAHLSTLCYIITIMYT